MLNHASPSPSSWRLRAGCAAVSLALLQANAFAADANAAAQGASAQIAQVEFNDLFLQRPGHAHIDLSRFDKGNPAVPGSYRVDLYVNQNWLGRAEVTLKDIGAGDVQPCFDRALLERVGVDLSKLSAPVAAGDSVCATLPSLVPDATVSFDNGEQRLDVSVPQASMSRKARGYVDPKYWDEGVPAALLQYNATVYRTYARGISATQNYLGLIAGFNVGGWRFRHKGSLTSGTGQGMHYQSVQTELQRSIAPLKSQLTLGDGFTDGTVFPSFGYRGVQLATDDMMYPESQRGYAPTVHGIANSNALVQISQNGDIIYQTNVAPGPFVINDLYPTGYGSDLKVIVTEADGSKHVSEVPYAPAVNALRPGVTRYAATLGAYRSQAMARSPLLFQGTVRHGFTNALTGYGGAVLAQGYVAGVVGAALNTRFGAFALDVTQANTSLPGQPGRSGQSVRLAYSKLIDPTGTNIAVAAYRYSSSGYLGLPDAMRMRDAGARGMNDFGAHGVQRSQMQVTLNQTLPSGWGAFYLSGSTQTYWNQGGNNTQFQAGYNNTFKQITYGVSILRQRDMTTGRRDNLAMLNVNIPLGIGAHSPYSTTNLQRETNGATTLQQSVTGSLGVDNAFSYGVNVGRSGGAGTPAVTDVGGNVAYVAPLATATANVSTGSAGTQFGAGVSGGIVVYGGGVAFSPAMGDTIAIVEAKDASGARVANASGLRIDPWGRAVVSNLTPFSDNEVAIDPKGLPMSVELKESVRHTAPTSGAVVRLKYATEGGGRAVLLRARTADGAPVPFGAQVTDAAGGDVGTVAQGGRILLRAIKTDSGELLAKWGDAHNQACRLSYTLPPAPHSANAAWTEVDSVCGG